MHAPIIVEIGGGVIAVITVAPAVVDGHLAEVANGWPFLGVQVRTAVAHPHLVVHRGGVTAGRVLVAHPIVDNKVEFAIQR